MARLPIKHVTLEYAGREILMPGAKISLEEGEMSLPWSYGTDAVGLVGAARAMVVDNGNARGSLTLPVVQDYPSIEAALTALVELKEWADEHTVGVLRLGLPAVQKVERVEREERYVVCKEGFDNINCKSIELDAKHARAGMVAVRLLGRASGAVSGKAVYLAMYEQQTDGEYAQVDVSYNTQVQAVGEWAEWRFGVYRTVEGRRMRFAALSDPSQRFADAETLYIQCGVRPEGDSSLIHTSVSPTQYLPVMEIVHTIEEEVEDGGVGRALEYNAGLQSLNTRLLPMVRGYRLVAEWEWTLA